MPNDVPLPTAQPTAPVKSKMDPKEVARQEFWGLSFFFIYGGALAAAIAGLFLLASPINPQPPTPPQSGVVTAVTPAPGLGTHS